MTSPSPAAAPVAVRRWWLVASRWSSCCSPLWRWSAYRSLLAKSHLERARAALTTAKSALLDR